MTPDGLRETIYDDVVPTLARAIIQERGLSEPNTADLDETYRMTLVLLYRLLFVAYAEDEGFLPRQDPRYERHSLTRVVREIHGTVTAGEGFDARSTAYWDDVARLTEAIHHGNADWGLPRYGGTLLSSDPEQSAAGARLADIQLADEQFGPALASLLLDGRRDGTDGPIGLRTVDVGAFGAVYEGLLASELSVADRPLVVDGEGRYVPVADDGTRAGSDGGGDGPGGSDGANAAVQPGQVYLHGQSGERKAAGAYYTAPRFVEHVLDHSLEPALEDHVATLEGLDDDEAAERFFDVRVADVSMGSGHFLVAAVDRIENRMAAYLRERSLPDVEAELDRLRDAAADAVPNGQDRPGVDRSQVLRRQIARRCLYGIDLDPLATELARLSVWLRTFVPGLPLTSVEYTLRSGDSLAGIGTLEEARGILDSAGACDADSDAAPDRADLLERAETAIDGAGRLADADAASARAAARTRRETAARLRDVEVVFDALAASRIDGNVDAQVTTGDAMTPGATADPVDPDRSDGGQAEPRSGPDPIHFPTAFPEVFGGDDPGFDAVVGNPPWEEATLEEDEFWTRYVPGYQGLTAADQRERRAALAARRPGLEARYERERLVQRRRRMLLKNGPYPGMGTGDPDLYKAFAWRFWGLTNAAGRSGIVLPRSALVAAGSETLRRTLLESADVTDITLLKNRDEWVFEGVSKQYTVALVGYHRDGPGETVPFRGPFGSAASFERGVAREPHRFPVEQVLGWTDTAAFPTLPPDPDAVGAFKRLTAAPPLATDGEWRARPHTELHATNDVTRADGVQVIHRTEEPPGEEFWPVYKGASFAHWTPDTGVRYGWGDPDIVVPYLQTGRENSVRYAGSRSVYADFDAERIHDRDTLPCLGPRLAFRDVARSTDSRTVIPALVPPRTFLTNKAPYVLWPRGDERDEAYLLGVLASVPLDWYARRFVELNLNYHIVNAFPVPRPGREAPLRRRIERIAGRLAAVDDRYAEWAAAVGVDCGPVDDAARRDLIHELDAVVARLYGLSMDQLETIYRTFDGARAERVEGRAGGTSEQLGAGDGRAGETSGRSGAVAGRFAAVARRYRGLADGVPVDQELSDGVPMDQELADGSSTDPG